MILSIVITSIMSYCLMGVVGYYTPLMLLSSVLMSVGAGLLATFQPDTRLCKWISYQLLFGVGVGFGMQQTFIAVQTSLPTSDIPIATAIMMFCQTLGGALFVSVAQNVFQNELIKNLMVTVPGLNVDMVVNVGATQLKSLIPTQCLSDVLFVYTQSLPSEDLLLGGC